MPTYGWLGLGVILAAQGLLLAGQGTVGRWFTPIVWTGYVMLADAMAFRLGGRSYLTTNRVEGAVVAVTSIAGWWLFELYNAPRFWRGGDALVGLWWQYHRMEPNLFLRRVGYDWAFATIFPALFLTAAVLRTTVCARVRTRAWAPSPPTRRIALGVGAVAAVSPLVFPSPWLVPLVWVGLVLVLETLNASAARPSWLADLAHGDASRLAALVVSGAVCGVLWEFWNYWAVTKWTYTIPAAYLGHVKIFEMPVLGYLGFLPFALECYAMYHWVRGVIMRGGTGVDGSQVLI